MGKRMYASWQKKEPINVKEDELNERKVDAYAIPGVSEVRLKKKSF